MAEASDLTSHKGKKKRSFTMEFKENVVAYAVRNSNRSAAIKFNVEPKRVREWRNSLENMLSLKPSRQRLEGDGRKCIDEELEER